MKLIPDFKITPFTRIAWVSTAAKNTWAGVIQQCATMVNELEIESVAAGQRNCAWSTIRREALPDFIKRCADKGLIVMPIKWVGSFPGNGFLHYTPKGDSQAYCIIARHLDHAIKFRDAFEAGDHEAQGGQLGFPACCSKAFTENWKAGFFDPIWQAAYDGPEKMKVSENEIFTVLSVQKKTFIHPYSNPLLRYIGLRVGFHIPHNFNCHETITAGIERLSLAKDRELVKLLEALLSMPMRAELFHGILTVKTPLFHLITYSVPTEEKYTIEVAGKFIPKEGIGI